MTPEIVRELLHYSPETGVFTWRERDRRWFDSARSCSVWNARYAGKRAGCTWTSPKSGYQNRQIMLLGKNHKEHHLAWMWMTDNPMPGEIDHDDQDGTNNRWRNLRSSTHIDNCRNQSKHRNNTSGVTGVTWDKRNSRWIAQCTLNGKNHFLGRFLEIDEAAMAVMEFRDEHGFSPRHGIALTHYHQAKAA